MEKVKDKIHLLLVGLVIVLTILIVMIASWFINKNICEISGGRYIWGAKGDMCYYDKK